MGAWPSRIAAVIVSCLVVFAVAKARSDTLELNDGTVHRGKVLSATAETVGFKTEDGKVLVIKRSDVKTLTRGAAPPAPAPPGPQAKATNETTTNPPGKEGWKTKKITFDFVDTPFPRVIEKLRELTGMNITLHASVKQAEARTVKLRVNEMRAESALNWLCALMGVTWYAKGDTILLGTQEAIEAVGGLPPRIRREYDLTSVLDAKQQNDEAAGDEWKKLLIDRFLPGLWDNAPGGPAQRGTIQYRAGKLIVVHNEEIQSQVSELLRDEIRKRVWARIESERSELEKRRARERPVRPRTVAASLDPTAARTLQAEAAKRVGKPIQTSVGIGAAVKLDLVLVPPGTFLMGSDSDPYFPAIPVHEVRIAKPFYMGKYEVTQEQWQAVMGFSPNSTLGAKDPLNPVNWDNCQAFLKKLNAMTGRKFSLASEAEWEYACRAGSTTLFCFGDDEKGLGDYAWYADNSNERCHPVGQKKPNAWSLFDMHGNVYEWCEDVWHSSYDGAPANGAPWLKGGYQGLRVFRSGGWRNESGLDSASRCEGFHDDSGPGIERLGLRVVLRDF